jgi:hypothetical protein
LGLCFSLIFLPLLAYIYNPYLIQSSSHYTIHHNFSLLQQSSLLNKHPTYINNVSNGFLKICLIYLMCIAIIVFLCPKCVCCMIPVQGLSCDGYFCEGMSEVYSLLFMVNYYLLWLGFAFFFLICILIEINSEFLGDDFKS